MILGPRYLYSTEVWLNAKDTMRTTHTHNHFLTQNDLRFPYNFVSAMLYLFSLVLQFSEFVQSNLPTGFCPSFVGCFFFSR